MKTILITLFAILSVGQFALAKKPVEGSCTVHSAKYPDLQRGKNAKVICKETILALGENGIYLPTDAIIIEEAGRSRNQVNLKITIVPVLGEQGPALAVLTWNEGGDAHAELVSQLPPLSLSPETHVPFCTNNCP